MLLEGKVVVRQLCWGVMFEVVVQGLMVECLSMAVEVAV